MEASTDDWGIGTPLGVLLVDHRPLVRHGLAELIASRRRHWRLVGQVATAEEAAACARDTDPEVIVLGCHGEPGRTTREVSQLATVGPSRILLLALDDDGAVIDPAIRAGARGMFRLDQPLDALLKAIDRIHAGEFWLDRATMARIFEQATQRAPHQRHDAPESLVARLTARERAIIAMLANHASTRNRRLAELLSLSENTLRNHLCSIYDKLGLTGRVDLYAFAKQHGLDRPPADLTPRT
jgi:two-component system, NarL family, nitrate/nitrite response regulator NarL